MKKLIFISCMGILILACRKADDQVAYEDTREAKDTTTYPLFIDGGTKVVYQFGRMSADKGLKLYLDTVSYDEWNAKKDSLLKNRE